MKSAIVLCVLCVAVMALARPEEEKYTNRYDGVDLDEILLNERVLDSYYKCIMDEGKCTPDGKELKSHVVEALETYCAKCTDAQKQGTRKVIGHLINNKAEHWQKLTAKYDPDHKYTTKYEDELKTIKA